MAENEYPVNAPVDDAKGSSYNYDAPGGYPSAGFGDPLAPAEGYEYDTGGDLPMRTLFDDLIGLPGINDITDIFGGEDMSEENPFAGDTDSNSSDPFKFNPNTDSSPFTASDDAPDQASQGSGFDMSSLSNGIDTGVGNTNNGSGNNFLGDAEEKTGSKNQADGNGNYFSGNDNQAEGNGNWNFGEGNQTNGNGNWNLNEDSGTPFDNLLSGENNPLADSGTAEGDIPFASGNNPVFAGGSTTPAPVGDGEMPDTADSPTGKNNVTNGNGNWNFGSDNTVSGNGNWSFGDSNTIEDGNGNWSLGDDNSVSGNGNRPSGSGNTISGNSNRPSGSGNTISGNRHTLDGDDQLVSGNADRYFVEDKDGKVTLVSDEAASDPNMTFDYEGVVSAGESDELLSGGLAGDGAVTGGDPITVDVYESLTGGMSSDISLPQTSSDPLTAIYLEGTVPIGEDPNVLMVS